VVLLVIAGIDPHILEPCLEFLPLFPQALDFPRRITLLAAVLFPSVRQPGPLPLHFVGSLAALGPLRQPPALVLDLLEIAFQLTPFLVEALGLLSQLLEPLIQIRILGHSHRLPVYSTDVIART